MPLYRGTRLQLVFARGCEFPVVRQKDGNLAANCTVISADSDLLLPPGQYSSLGGSIPISTASTGIKASMIFRSPSTPCHNSFTNLAHTVGTAPDGVLEISANQYWLSGTAGAGFANSNTIKFSQAGIATIAVPADVNPGGTVV